MKNFLEKISSYNIFNYLLPGVLFAVVVDATTRYAVIQDDIILGLFVYYFLGLVISRIGSLVIEPVLRRSGFVTFAPYRDFLAAAKADDKIEMLSEVNNMYRTLCSLFFSIAATVAFDRIAARCSVLDVAAAPAAILALLVLFALSYRKQTRFIYERVTRHKES